MMKGMHHILVETSKLRYEFTIRRNITIIKGDSATGKTTLVDLLNDFSRDKSGHTVRLQSDVPCIVFTGPTELWDTILKAIENSIIFIDEGNPFIFSEDFAIIAKESSNYYVLITRSSLPNLPYSIHEIYGIRTSGKYHYPEKIYHEFYPIYGKSTKDILFTTGSTEVLIVEDAQSGYQFFQRVC